MKRILNILFLSAFVLTVSGDVHSGMKSKESSAPKVIPALQCWKQGSGIFNFPEEGNISIACADSSVLYTTALTLSADLKQMFGYNYGIVVSEKKNKGNIILSIIKGKEDVKLGKEGYSLKIGRQIEIKANQKSGAFWGTRTLLQMIHNQPEGLQKGEAVDYPKYQSRGFMLDVGRKFFTMDFLKDYVKIMAFYKMNEFHIHLNDNGFVEFADNDWNKAYSAFRLESERYPGLTAKDGAYTKEEFKAFQKMAAEYGIKVIPEIDIPAHSLAFTHYNPDLAAQKTEYGFDHLDLYKKEVYDFFDSLFGEYLSGNDPVFVGPEVHIGTDEYNIKEAEQFRHFTNHYINLIKSYDKIPRVWGSLNQMKGDTGVDLNGSVVSAWNYGWMDLESALNAGAKVVNMCDEFLYIVPAVNYYHDFLDCEWLYNNWTPEMMRKDYKIQSNPNLLGAMFAVWNDRVGNGISQQDVHVRSFPALQLLSDKLWKGENQQAVSYERFKALCQTTPEAPGVNLLAVVDSVTELTPARKELTLKGNDTIVTAISEIGYPYAVEFELHPASKPAIDAILFKGPHSEFITNWNNTGKLAFRRDGYEFVFHNYRLPSNEWTKIRVEGDIKGTTLIINDEKVERLEGRTGEVYNAKMKRKDKMWYQETLIFPLNVIGDLKMGYEGKIRNLKCIPL